MPCALCWCMASEVYLTSCTASIPASMHQAWRQLLYIKMLRPRRYIPERMLHERGTPRPLFLVGAGVATAAVAVLAAFADLGALYPVTILAGLAFGAPSGLTPHVMSRVCRPGRAPPCHHPGLWCALRAHPAFGSGQELNSASVAA